MVIAARRNERRTGAHPLHHLEAEHAAIEAERALEIGDLEMDMPDPGAGNDGWVLGHVVSACDSQTSPRLRGEVELYAKRKVRVRGYRSIVGSRFAEGAPHPDPLRASFARLDPAKNGEREKRAHARSDTSPSGSPNSNVFSVIDTIV